jgi:sirohydrochlorin ferrochelatase
MTLILVAHGTRSPAGQAQVHALAARVGRRGPHVRLSYVDVQTPRLDAVVSTVDGPAVAVPLLLTAGYHVRVDIASAIAGTPVVAAPPLQDARLVAALAERVAAAGPADAVVLAAAGSSDERARSDVAAVAAAMPFRCHVGYASPSVTPRVPEVVAGLRAAGASRVVVAAYLLVDGLFHRSLHDAGADAVTEPLVTHPAVADLVLRRYEEALTAVPRPLRRGSWRGDRFRPTVGQGAARPA